jgi:hypothetical protein
METITIPMDNENLSLEMAWGIAWFLAKIYNPKTSLAAWFDKKRGKYSPSRFECAAEGISDWEEYGLQHGGRKKFVVGSADFVFIFT